MFDIPRQTMALLKQADLSYRAKNYKTAFRIYRDLGKHGYPQLGFLYMRGYGCERDRKLAIKYFTLALCDSTRGSSDVYSSLVNLGVLYTQEGQYDQALHWHRRALQLRPHDADILNNVGYIHQKRGDLREAIVWFRRAAELGESYSKYSLGLLYREGSLSQGISPSPELSRHWFQRLFTEANPGTLYQFGRNFEKGHDCFPRNFRKARMFYQKAFERGMRAKASRRLLKLARRMALIDRRECLKLELQRGRLVDCRLEFGDTE